MTTKTGTADGPTREIGNASGNPSSIVPWSTWGGSFDDLERVPELMWPTSVTAYRSMMNDAQLYSLMNGLTLPIRAYRWFLEPNGSDPGVVERISRDYNLPIGLDGEFNRRRAQQRFSFDKHLEDALRALYYGHYFFEQFGEVEEDMKWHLKKLAVRPPHTVSEISVANDGGLEWIRQMIAMDPPKIPITQLVAYVWDREGSNWVGRSMFRSVYRNHIVKDRVLRVGAINIERAGGVPYVQAPEGASGDQIRELDALARRFRVGEGAGAALPHGAQLKFAMAAGGDGAVNYLKQQNEEMARAFLQMVNMLGQTNSGSRALGGEFRDIAQVAQYTIAKWFADTFNEHVIEDDVEWNEGPTQEFAPLLAFDAGNTDPLGGFEEALDEDDGIQVEDEETRKKLTDGKDPKKKTARRRTSGRRSTQRGTAGGRVRGSQEASPLMLPARPLRRDPYEHEINAAVDYMALDSAFQSSLDLLVQEIRLARTFQIDELHDAIVAANGDLAALAGLSVSTEASRTIQARLAQTASIAIDQAVDEARRQGVTVPRQSIEDLESVLRARADAVDKFLASDVAQSASRQALRLTGGSLTPAEVAQETKLYLLGLTGAVLKDMLGGAIQQSINAGRKLVFQRDDQPGTLYASELLDTNTCGDCVQIDGTQYQTVLDAERDYPTGGYIHCQGRERCRGTLVKVYQSETPSTLDVPFAVPAT